MPLEEQQKHIAIIDWETLSTEQNAKVLSLGITCFFAGKTNTIEELKQTTKYWNISLFSQKHRHTSQSTTKWWSQQNPKTWEYHRTEPLLHPTALLQELTQYIKDMEVEYLVGNGIGFDNAILKNLCQDFNEPYPIPFWGDLDLRTIKWLAKSNRTPFPHNELTQHRADHDCIVEAMAFQEMYASIMKKIDAE